MINNSAPNKNYGILIQDTHSSMLDDTAEQVRRIGYAVFESGWTADQIKQFSEAFNLTRASYVKKYGEERLRSVNEFHTVRAPLTHGDPMFVLLATNPYMLDVIRRLIIGKFILNQQNCVINPPGETYNQGAWHRDLPYQHFISSSPLAVNALFCVDDFTLENGSTFVLPASHQSVNYPSEEYIKRNALQVEAKAGQFILLDCMLFHTGGYNRTKVERRAVNHVFTIPYFKQQIKLPGVLRNVDLNLDRMELFGFGFEEPSSIEQYILKRTR